MIYKGGCDGEYKILPSFLGSACPPDTIVRIVPPRERFPKSTAVNPNVRRTPDRGDDCNARSWDSGKAVREVHLWGYYSCSLRARWGDDGPAGGVGRWPKVLRRCVQGRRNSGCLVFWRSAVLPAEEPGQ